MPPLKNSAPVKITVYALQTCSHCKATRNFLQERGVSFKTVYVDFLTGDERSTTLRYLKKINPSVSFPTVEIGETVIVGFKEAKIIAALDALSADNASG